MNQNKVLTNPGDMIKGDKIIVFCRKPQKNWEKIQKSNQHDYFKIIAKKNAQAIIDKKFTNQQAQK